MNDTRARGFWDSHQPDEYKRSLYLTSTEVEELIDAGTPFLITTVSEATSKFGPKTEVGLLLNGEERRKSFTGGSVPGRDDLLNDVSAHLKGGGAPVWARFEAWGERAIGIAPADRPLDEDAA